MAQKFFPDSKQLKERGPLFLPVLTTMPAVAIGIAVMIGNEISSYIWMQNLFFFLVFALLSFFQRWLKPGEKNSVFYIFVPLLLLIVTFWAPDMNGVHRWISLGSFRVNAALAIIPLAILILWKLRQRSRRITGILTVIICVLLLLQPDASQLTAFAVPMLIIFWAGTENKAARILMAGFFFIIILLSWVNLDSLPPVSYVEGIVGLTGSLGWLWWAAGVLSLVLLPLPFLLFPPRHLRLLSRCLGVYYSVMLLSTLAGNFPVPLMGYGVSTFIGYFIAIIWYTRELQNARITDFPRQKRYVTQSES